MHMLPEDMQLANERRFARQHIDGYLRDYIKNDPELWPAVLDGVSLLTDWVNTEFSYESKRIRVSALKTMDLNELVLDVIVGSAYCRGPELFTSFTAQMAGKLGFDDKLDSIKTVAEITAVLCDTNLFDLIKNDRFDSWKIESNIELDLRLQEFIKNSCFLPPLVMQPKILKHNKDTPYLTIGQESRILNKGHHNEDICLDVINKKNATELCLDVEFLCRVEETPNSPLDSPEKVTAWNNMKVQSYEFYHLMVAQGNKFHLDHKPDKRGRLYAVGYHISTQGSPIKKAMIELAKQEVVTGVPMEFQL
jgi:hypothetical protein